MTAPSLRIDAAAETQRISAFIARVVRRSPASGVVLGLSGGVDSAVTGALCVRALGKSRVVGLIMPSDHTPSGDTHDAQALAGSWGARSRMVPISAIVRAIEDSAGIEGTKISRANIEARARMAVLYYYANTLGYLVAGTGDRSEQLVGFSTKFGDGAADLLPIAHLYKTQVRLLARHLGLPKRIAEKPASPQLWPGHKASDELPADYDKLDVVLHWLFDLKAPAAKAAAKAGVGVEVAERALRMHLTSGHKRRLPPSLA